ncbi:MAG: L-histidine N(alpha)-methyltransferase [Polyangiaceae bacterium]
MKTKQIGPITLYDYAPTPESFRDEVLRGLARRPKSIPCKFFYDERGSRLFDEICDLDEYYLTRTETAILQASAGEMAALVGPGALLVELGSGSGIKTRLLLDELVEPAGYVPVDIAREHLIASAALLCDAYPHLDVLPVCADYTRAMTLPRPQRAHDGVCFFFPGSTIGNMNPTEATSFLSHLRTLAGGPCGVLVGVDLKKDRTVLEPAYNDKRGVTAAFNMNLFTRINREIGGDFDASQFRHRAFFNEAESRVEMHLVSACRQTAHVGPVPVTFDEGETILTEYSHKFSLEHMKAIAEKSGFRVKRVWTDEKALFSVQYFRSV